MVEDLKKTLKPTRTFERGTNRKIASTIDPMADVKELQEALGLERPPLIMECFDIANIGTAHCVASMVRFNNGVPDNASYRRYRIKAVTGQNDFVSMAEVVRRRYSRILLEGRERLGDDADITEETPLESMRRLEKEAGRTEGESSADGDFDPGPRRSVFVRLPDLVIVDGGKGQLGMAMKELQRLGLQDLPVIGLAKEREEIFRPGESDPIVLSHDTGALKLLQRMRDEAHRWANGYHQLLLKRRVAESILDDCPGVSKTRKAVLLRAFGSVARLRKATADQIAAVPGIGKALAEEVARFLETYQPDSGD
jgi:excinuclease ABC subunit C